MKFCVLFHYLWLCGVARDWHIFMTVVEGVSKLLGGASETQLGEGQEEQVMYVAEDVAPQEADEEAVAMIEETYGVTSMFGAPGGIFSILCGKLK